nr:hypothetical protein [Vibrio splendidus]MCC4880722.1 hypothetical protein [Vibrio splendidus]
MNKISRSELKRLHRIVNGSGVIRLLNTGTVKTIHEDYGIGSLVAQCHISFNALDKIEIRRLIKNTFNIDLNDPISGNRISYSAKAGQEKLATIAPKSKNIELRSLYGSVRVNGKECTLLNETSSIVVSMDDVATIEHDIIIIVENYEAFRNLTSAILPKTSEFKDPLVAYRGDGQRAAVDSIIKEIGIKAYSWMDYDPQGFNLALAKKEITAGTLIPSNPRAMFSLNYGKSESFNKQIPFIEGLRSRKIDWVNAELDLICEKTKVLTQEGCIHANHELKVAQLPD